MDKLKLTITYKFINPTDVADFAASHKAKEAKIRVLDFLIKKIVLKAD